MNKRRKFLALLLVFGMIFTLVQTIVGTMPVMAASVSASETVFEYELNNEGNAVITGYQGNASALSIPGTLEGYKVAEIGRGVFKNNTYLRSVIIPDSVTTIGINAFSGCSNLNSVTLSKNVTSIGYSAFYNCDALTSIEIPKSLQKTTTSSGGKLNNGIFADCDNLKTVTFEKGITKIVNHLFANCTGLERIEIPDTVTIIERDAFYGCKNLKEVIITSSVTELGVSAFESCTSLSEINIPDSVTVIEDSCFSNCTSLNQIVIPDSVTTIGNNAFEDCSNLKSVTLSKNVTSIGYSAFYNCDALTGIEIPKSLQKTTTSSGGKINDGVFADCDNLKTVTFEKGITKIVNHLFANCTGLERIEIPDTVTIIEEDAFYGCKNLKEVIIASSVTELGARSFESCTSLTEINIPDSVTVIDDSCFSNCTSLNQIVIPDSVATIGNNAFSGCSNLNSVTLSKNVTSIGYSAFYNCDALTGIEIPKSLQKTTTYTGSVKLSDGIFADCDNLKTVTFEKGITKIVNHLFANCTGLERIEIPDTVTIIEEDAFYGCKNLKEVIIASSVTELGVRSFESCTSLSGINIPDSVTVIDDSCFSNCTSLNQIVIPDSVTTIGSSAFSGCSNLSSVTLSKSLTEMGTYVFYNCESLAVIEIPETVTNIANYAFYGCKSLTSITMGNNVTKIGERAFYGCESLSLITLPDALTQIGTYGFYNCDALTAITIPDSVTSIGTYCFSNCESLSDVKLGTGLTTIPSYAFDLCPALEKIVLPYRIEKINANAFTNCTKLTEVTIPRATTTIASNVFSYPSKMTIYGISGTYAETYANNNNIAFVNREIPADSVTLNKTEMILNKGSSAALVISVAPENFTDEVTWKSSDTSIVTVTSAGAVKGVGVGTAVIRVSAGNVSASCTVTVVQPVTRVSLNNSSVTLAVGETFALTASVSPDNAYNKNLEWTSSDESVAIVDQNGLVTSVKSGTAKITAKAVDGSEKSAYCNITVTGNSQVVTSAEQLESLHDYENNSDLSWIYTLPGTTEMSITFDERTNLESGFDYLYIYDGNGSLVGKYTGTELAGKTITVSGDTVKIQLVSDNAGTAWGFKVSEVSRKANVSEETKDFVRRLYTLVLGRDAEEGGLTAWSEALTNFSSNGVDAGYGFVFSDECKERNLSNEAFVEMLYNTFMNRPSDEGGRSAWVSQLDAGVDREKIFEGFVYSLEFGEICANYGISVGNVEDVVPLWETLQNYHNQNSDVTAFVARCYTQALGRAYDPVGLEDWCRVILTQEDTPTAVAKSFIFSDEFVGKGLSDEEYVKVLYRTFMGREADEGGLAAWVGVLQSGEEDREKVLEGFANSQEFAEILESFGLN